jgi:hypothetical protein
MVRLKTLNASHPCTRKFNELQWLAGIHLAKYSVGKVEHLFLMLDLLLLCP